MRWKGSSSVDDEFASSVQSMASNDDRLFGSPGTDLSDCEYCEKRLWYLDDRRFFSPFSSPRCSTPSFHSAMSVRESTPLLGTTSPTYKTLEDEDSDSLGPADLSSQEILKSYRSRYEEKPEKKKQSSLVTIFSVWNTIMGSSLLTMAWGIERAGLPAALALMAVMAALCLYTAYLLLEVNRHHGSQTCEVPALCRNLLGRGPEAVAHAFSLVVLLGANVVYWILITNFLYFTVNYFVDVKPANATYPAGPLCPHGANTSTLPLLDPASSGDDPWYWGLHSTVPLYVAAVVFPLLNFRNVTFFTKFNSLGTLSVLYLLVFVIVKGWIWGVNIALPAAPHAGRDAAVLSGMLALSFYIHNIIITIMSHNARQENNNILNNFDMHDAMTAAARVLLLFQVVTVYPLVAFMLRSEATLLLPVKDSDCLMVAINVAIVATCILVACLFPRIGTVIRYTGAVSGLVHIFALPSLLQLQSLKLRNKLTWWKAVFYSLIMAFGAVNLLMQFFISE